jgi:hypothetical protein
MSYSNQYSFNYQSIKLGLFFLFITLNFQVFGNEMELENKSKFGLNSISFVQESINVSKSDESVFFSLRAYSQLGLNKVIVYFKSPSGTKTIETTCVNKKKSKVGLLLGRILFKKKSEIGEWEINKIIIVDSEGNQESYNKEFLIKNKFSYSLQVKDN